MINFFEVSTLEMWPDMMFSVVDITGPDQISKEDNKPFLAIIFVIYIFMTTLFIF